MGTSTTTERHNSARTHVLYISIHGHAQLRILRHATVYIYTQKTHARACRRGSSDRDGRASPRGKAPAVWILLLLLFLCAMPRCGQWTRCFSFVSTLVFLSTSLLQFVDHCVYTLLFYMYVLFCQRCRSRRRIAPGWILHRYVRARSLITDATAPR